ncbi:MAG TPA: hypothetical protein PK514_12810 [Spirochaetota bacterium]|nr:hypothetical protein [Spirochaetota bacterium]
MCYKISAAVLIALAVFSGSCKNDDIFVDPAYVFMKWSHAVKVLDYTKYSSCEAFPKSADVFRELYSKYYYADLITRDLGEYNPGDVRTDIDGKKYTHRMVYFECDRIERRTAKTVESMKGEVEFIQYVDEPGSRRGWLMYSRTIIRSGTDLPE